MNLRDAVEGKEYVVRQIDTEDEDLNAFLFSLAATAENILPWSPI